MTDNALDPVALLPCPFCGAPGVLEHAGEHWSVGCFEEGAEGECIVYISRITFARKTDAIAAWNRRAIPTARKELVERLDGMATRAAATGLDECADLLREAASALSAAPQEKEPFNVKYLEDCATVLDRAADNQVNPSMRACIAHNLRAAASALRAGDGWRCFHCDEVFPDRAAAEDHFGTRQSDAPLCAADLRELVAARKERDEYADIRARLLGRLNNVLADGFVLVPREPTEAMIDAAGGEYINLERADDPSYQPRDVWEAMIAAAPQARSMTKEDARIFDAALIESVEIVDEGEVAPPQEKEPK